MLSLERLEHRQLLHSGTVHTSHGDNIPDYAFEPDAVTVQAGSWFDPATWSNGVPTAETDVRILHDVTLPAFSTLASDFDANGIVDRDDLKVWIESVFIDDRGDANGDGITDAFDLLVWQRELGLRSVPLQAVVEDVTVEPSGSLSVDGSLKVQTLMTLGDLRITGETIIRDLAFDYQFDPQQFGHGVLALGTGSLHVEGGRIASENPAGVRGHVMAMERADVRITDSVFEHLGRTTIDQLDNTHLGSDGTIKHVGTNQVGRYALHLHHLTGPENLSADVPQFLVSRNEFRDGLKWAVAVHNAHYGEVSRNTIVRFSGAGIVLEDGNEYGNLIAYNSISQIVGSGLGIQGRNNGLPAKLVGDGSPENPFRTVGDHGHEGAGLWFRGIANDVIGNVVENAPFGVVVWSRFGASETSPAFKGASPKTNGRLVEHGTQDGHVWKDNSVLSASVGMALQGVSEDAQEDMLIQNQTIKNCEIGVQSSYTFSLTFQGGLFEGRGGRSIFVHPGHLKLVNIDGGAVVRNWKVGYHTHAGGRVGDAYFENNGYDVVIENERGDPYKNAQPWTILIDGARFNDQSNNITYRMGDYFNVRDYSDPLYVLVKNYNGTDADYQLFMNASDPDYVPPTGNPTTTRGERISPEAGLANRQLWDKYLRSVGGFVTPADAYLVPGINAKVSSIPEDRTGPKILSQSVTTTGTTATIRFTTDQPARFALEWNQGDISVEKWANLPPASTEFKTEHEITITGLEPGKSYQAIVRLADEAGNLTIPRRPALKYIPQFKWTTLK